MMSAFVIRDAVIDDCEEVFRLIQESAHNVQMTEKVLTTAEELRKHGFGEYPAFNCFVVERSDSVATKTLLGFCLYCMKFSTKQGKSIFIEDIYVTPNSSRDEIGTMLMKRLTKLCIDNGYTRLAWIELKENNNAISFYTKNKAFNLTEKRGWYLFSLCEDSLNKLAGK